MDALCGLPIYLLDAYGEVAVSRLREEIAYAVRRHGVVLAIVDHLHFALGVRKAGEDERLLIDAAAQAIQSTALELGIHIVVVMHPAKIRAGEDGRARQPEIGDLKGSSGPAQFADNVMRISRDQSAAKAVLTLLKVRSELGHPGHVAFAFDPESLRFTDVFAHAEGDA
ncbi:MAG: DnaB-like helicase C-terminal domain-containing protein [Polyangiaceae bacterium]